MPILCDREEQHGLAAKVQDLPCPYPCIQDARTPLAPADDGAWTSVREDGRGGGADDAVALHAGDMGDELLLEVHSDTLELATGRVPVADVWSVRDPAAVSPAHARPSAASTPAEPGRGGIRPWRHHA